MLRLRLRFPLAVVFLLPTLSRAQDKPATRWIVDRALTVTPQSSPVPALRFRLFPLSSELKEGNAVPIYLRLVHERNDASRKYLAEMPAKWNLLPVDQLPVGEIHKFLHEHQYLLRQLEVGARRRHAEWDYTLDEPNPIGLLLPDAQVMRFTYGPLIILQARAALADGDFSQAAHHLETGFAFVHHLSDAPTLIHRLVALSVANQLASAVADYMERGGGPNLYWALTVLPRPLVDLRPAMEWEYLMLEQQQLGLTDLERSRPAEQWTALLRQLRVELRQMDSDGKGNGPRHAHWFPKDSGPDDAPESSPELATARSFVAQRKNLPADKVEAMPAAQVLLQFILGVYQQDRDDWYRSAYLPYPQSRPLQQAATKRLREASVSEGHLPARLLLPGLDRVMSMQMRFEREIAVLRIVEALRMYSASHDGRLPERLEEVTEAPIPDDPGTGKAFDYHHKGDTAVLISEVPNDPSPGNGLRYRISVRK